MVIFTGTAETGTVMPVFPQGKMDEEEWKMWREEMRCLKAAFSY